MSTDLKVESQCNEACLKANRMLGLMKRTFVVKTPEVMLDNDSVMAKTLTVNGFKTKLERERAKKMGLFLD